MEVDHRTTTPYHLQANGFVESLNHTLADMLSMYVNSKHTNWDEILPYITFAYNTSRQESTEKTPFYLREEVGKRLIEVQERQKQRYDARHRPAEEFQQGEEELVYKPFRKVGRAEKLLHRWLGPYTVVRRTSSLN